MAGRLKGEISGFETVQPDILRHFPELVAACGGDAAALLAAVGLDDNAPTYRQHVALLARAAASLDRADFGMLLAERQGGVAIYGPLGDVMRHSRTFGDALTYVVDHVYAHSLAARVWLRPCPDEEMVFSGHDILLGGINDRAQAIEQILLVGHLGARELTGGMVRARRVHFRHQPISPPRAYRRRFECDVLFGAQDDGLFFSDADMACPIVDPDAAALRIAADYVETGFPHQVPPTGAVVRGLVMRWLGTEHCTNEHVAAELGLHKRTLHRRLEQEGTSFRAIKDAIRREVMLYYLQHTRLDLSLISERLGFAEQSVMSRSSVRWFDCSPSAMRARGGAGAAPSLPPGSE